MTGIEVKELQFSYGRDLVIDQASFSIAPGEFVGIIGPNGGGKTTLLQLLMGFLSPLSGSVAFSKAPLIGYVPQVHLIDRLYPITVKELILLGALSSRRPFRPLPSEIIARAEGLMSLFDLADVPFSSLSGGMAQKALLARALLSNPTLLLLDEATANVDPATRETILEVLNLSKGKTTILMVTHDLGTILAGLDRVLCVERSVKSLLPSEVCAHFTQGVYHTLLPVGSP